MVDHRQPQPSPSVPRWLAVANAALAVTAFALVLGRLVMDSVSNRGWWAYSAGEWLINYRDGFIRRGLVGELIVSLPTPDLLTLQVGVLALNAVVLALFGVLVFLGMARTGSPWPLALWLVPTWGIVGAIQSLWQPWGAASTQFAFRKEQFFIFIALLLAIVWRHPVTRERRWWWTTALAGVLLAFGGLVHEGFVLVTAAAITVMALRSSDGIPIRSRVCGILLALTPGGVMVLLSARHPGTTAAQQPIWDAVDGATRQWYATGPPSNRVLDSDLPSAVSFIGSTVQIGVDVVNFAYIESGTWPLWAFSAAVMVALVVSILIMCDRSPTGSRATVAGAVIVCAATAPLFVVGFDWGRWIAVACTMTVVVGLHRVLSATAIHPASPTLLNTCALILALIAAAAIGLPEVGDPPLLRWFG